MSFLRPRVGPGGHASWLFRRTSRAAVHYAFDGDSYKTRGRRAFPASRPEFTPTLRDRSLNGKQRRIARKAANHG